MADEPDGRALDADIDPVWGRFVPLGRADQLGEDAAAADQLGVGAGLDDPAVVEDEDAVGVAQGGQAVGDEDHGAVGPGGVDRLLDQPLADVVQGARSPRRGSGSAGS